MLRSVILAPAMDAAPESVTAPDSEAESDWA